MKMKGDFKLEDGHMKASKENQETYDDEIFNVVSSVVQWYLVLEQIRSERASESYFAGSRAKCQCLRAKEIIEKCGNVRADISSIIEDKRENGKNLEKAITNVQSKIEELGSSLRSNISIQIPASLASSSAELRERACQLVMTGAVKDIVSEAMAGVLSSVEDLLNLAKCDHDHEAAGAETKPTPVGPLARVVDLGWPRGKRRKAEDDGNSEKPKRFRAARKSMDEEEGFRPYKPPPPSPDVLNMLEKKKKLVKKNGLLQFVLWREAYRGERERATEVETRSAKKFLAMARRRKRSPFQSVRNNV